MVGSLSVAALLTGAALVVFLPLGVARQTLRRLRELQIVPRFTDGTDDSDSNG